MTNTSTAHQGSQNRNYLFSPEMNIYTMSTMASLSYSILFISVTKRYLSGEWPTFGNGIENEKLILGLAIGFTIIAVILSAVFLFTCFKAIKGVDGVKYYEPQPSKPIFYVKTVVILVALAFFSVIQIFYFYRNLPITSNPLDYIVCGLMLLAFVFGIAGLIRAIGLHRQYKRNNKPNL